jgi:iron complex transport system substrate-binding protein
VIRRLLTAAAVLALYACSPHDVRPPAARYSSPTVDHSRPLPGSPRIISLAPSLTEIAYAIGCGPLLVGDTAFDDFPAAARALPHIGDVRTADLERVAALHPTLVIALRDEESEASPIERRLGVPVAFLPNRDLRDLDDDIAGVGHACGRPKDAAALTARLERRIAAVRTRSLAFRHKPRVLYLIGLPGYSAGPHSFLSDMIDVAGGINVAASADEPYPNLSAESIVRMNPEVVIVAGDTPFDADVRAREPWRSIAAVRNGRVLRPPSDDIMERNGPRIVDGLDWLQHALGRS